jgi:hypothetical protein
LDPPHQEAGRWGAQPNGLVKSRSIALNGKGDNLAGLFAAETGVNLFDGSAVLGKNNIANLKSNSRALRVNL